MRKLSDSIEVIARVPRCEIRRYLVYLKYWTLNLRPLMVYPKVLSPPNFIIKASVPPSLQKASLACQRALSGQTLLKARSGLA